MESPKVQKVSHWLSKIRMDHAYVKQNNIFSSGPGRSQQISKPIPSMGLVIGQNVAVLPATPREHSMGKLKNVAGVRILGIGEVDRLSCLGVGSLTELPLNPETLNPKT